jgi:hypothetical protein
MRFLAMAMAVCWASIPGVICLVPFDTNAPELECHKQQGSEPGQSEMRAYKCCAELVGLGAAVTSASHRDDVSQTELPAMPYVLEIGTPMDVSVLSILARDIHSPPNDPCTSSILRI